MEQWMKRTGKNDRKNRLMKQMVKTDGMNKKTNRRNEKGQNGGEKRVDGRMEEKTKEWKKPDRVDRRNG